MVLAPDNAGGNPSQQPHQLTGRQFETAPDPEVFFRESLRVLRPSGRFAFTVWAMPEQTKGHVPMPTLWVAGTKPPAS